jgi:hypothetical protein
MQGMHSPGGGKKKATGSVKLLAAKVMQAITVATPAAALPFFSLCRACCRW